MLCRNYKMPDPVRESHWERGPVDWVPFAARQSASGRRALCQPPLPMAAAVTTHLPYSPKQLSLSTTRDPATCWTPSGALLYQQDPFRKLEVYVKPFAFYILMFIIVAFLSIFMSEGRGFLKEATQLFDFLTYDSLLKRGGARPLKHMGIFIFTKNSLLV